VPQNQVWRHLNAKLFQPERALDVVWHLFNELAGLFKDLIIKRSGHSALIPPILRNGDPTCVTFAEIATAYL
jgi:hypothetical protein